MSTSRTTQCRVCGAELATSWWKALVGIDVDTCDDAVACVTRFRVGQPGHPVGRAFFGSELTTRP
jgi:RNA polymerase subunit RPABC4/transcription elongation factor Spt4